MSVRGMNNASAMDERSASRRPLIAAALLLGVGLGGFIDGIVFHQILQVHNMLSATLPPTDLVSLEVNMFWDGLFHAFTWITTATGLALLWRAVMRGEIVAGSTPTFVGSLSLGWGLFNLVEGIIDHHILEIHHVVETPDHLLYDLLFLGSGIALSAAGLAAIRADATSARVRVGHL